ncbi:hypothetical protein COU19_01960 [Candidatus Kaiserbacteria bacterium CG10_big_fil_rev_8_21_14_0_10_56_12]|uniref:Transcobalamin-like C-terminal domain-containing protein n=1 Tax=Candidatus Kaiserbacteria bacterium CG10_big_fil_rev_8_21_14_0_10_56_12 TaxID=1974611 RepID=A0A2H0U9S7_9BACT|nr:MAG: hypothetical protein COU19_01960 [Candidatus Kaiserbacteria bacterium CG10_big_fil_rev_8_21_14_0_10_56_12]
MRPYHYSLLIPIVLVLAVGCVLLGSRPATAPEQRGVEMATTTRPAVSPMVEKPVEEPHSVTPATAPRTNATFSVGSTTHPIFVHAGETVLEAMNDLSASGRITYSGRDYPGLGLFVDTINGTKNGGGRYWVYYVNDISASAGISTTVLQPGDAVVWKYAPSYSLP